jgi:hypothetical protein
MGCHKKAVARIGENIRQHPDSTDFWLDQLFDALARATEWDASEWGFDPCRWMMEEREELTKRAKGKLWPKEVI